MLFTILIAFAVAENTKCMSDKCTGEPATDTFECCEKLNQLGFEDMQTMCKESFTEEECEEPFELFGCQDESQLCMKSKIGDETHEECVPTKNEAEYKEFCKATSKYFCDAGYTKVEVTNGDVTAVHEWDCPASPDPGTKCKSD